MRFVNLCVSKLVGHFKALGYDEKFRANALYLSRVVERNLILPARLVESAYFVAAVVGDYPRPIEAQDFRRDRCMVLGIVEARIEGRAFF